MYRILALNPGSTSTKIAFFHDENESFAVNLHHSTQDLENFSRIIDQYAFRLQTIEKLLEEKGLALNDIDAFVGRGGLLIPISSGTFAVDDIMLKDLYAGVQGEHASNLGGILAYELAKRVDKPAFIVDPVVVDELQDLARFSGHPELPRRSIFHALNQKAVARKAATHLKRPYTDLNLVVAHLGGGISVAAHEKGRVIDVNNALDGDGPFSPERSGSVPAGDLVRLCYSGKDCRTVLQMIKGKGGMVAYLGTNDMRHVQHLVADGDRRAITVYRAMAYQIAKEIGAMSVVLKGRVDAIVFTGGIAFDKILLGWISEYCSHIAPILIFAGEEEMQSLALGALRVLRGDEKAKVYRHDQES
ncbi:butyrate kinase [candidate division KSB1 bacterium]|nr:butyrate kinase [candidate division KSB1 bacterium]